MDYHALFLDVFLDPLDAHAASGVPATGTMGDAVGSDAGDDVDGAAGDDLARFVASPREVVPSVVVCPAEKMKRKRARHNQTERNRVARMNTLFAMIAKELGQEYHTHNKADLLRRVLEVLQGKQRSGTPSSSSE